MAQKENIKKTAKKAAKKAAKVVPTDVGIARKAKKTPLAKKEPLKKTRTFVVIKTGGKQYKVEEDQELLVEKLEGKEGEKVTFGDVLLIAKDKDVKIGTPTVPQAKVEGKIISQEKGKKVIVFKMKPKKRYRKKAGHRQLLTRVKIEKIFA